MELTAVSIFFFAPVWGATAWYLFRASSLSGPTRLIDAVLMLPVVLILLVSNLALTNALLPGTLALLNQLFSARLPGFVVAPFAFATSAPLPILAFVGWRRLLRRYALDAAVQQNAAAHQATARSQSTFGSLWH